MFIDSEINNVNGLIKKMSSLVQSNIRQAIGLYLSKGDNEDTTINDEIVNQYEKLIDEVCIDILIKERPYSKDLREIFAVIKMVDDLERIGDHAEDIKNFSLKLRGTLEERNPEIDIMLDKALKMIDDAIESFVTMDKALAVKTIKADDEIDAMYDKIIESLTNYPIKSHTAQNFVIYTTLIVKYIERIADHATNIAEWTVYIVAGIFKDEIQD
ncbi:MAG: phosphate signaling complex protein PhoU [Bacillales bacterium]|nr:phosphate signaling complex protein PhoU [Bacillales bacterium]